MNITQENYLNVTLEGKVRSPQGVDGIEYYVTVYPENSLPGTKFLFCESIFISGTVLGPKFETMEYSEKAVDEMKKYTFSKARARLALELYESGEEYKSNTIEPEITQVDDEAVQKWILKALFNIRKMKPQTYKSVNLDVDGFCYLLKISKDQYCYNADFLLKEQLIKYGMYEEQDINNGGINITSKCINY